MDGIHDLGGMHGFGLIRVERDEPVFHARWEGRVFALTGATGGSFAPNVDKFRHAIERMHPVEYLSAGYYGRWLRAIETRLVEAGELEPGAVDRLARELVSRGVMPGEAAPGRTASFRPVATARVHDAPSASTADSAAQATPAAARPKSRFRREIDRPPRFAAGAAVVARADHPAGHTRLPRYVRGKRGCVESVYDAYVFPDTNAHDRGEEPQHVYCVAFDGAELWGADAEPGTSVRLDLFESYLEPVA
jgi:nitrile hydratase